MKPASMNHLEAGSIYHERFSKSRSRRLKDRSHRGLGQRLNKQKTVRFGRCVLRRRIVQPEKIQCCSAAAENAAEQQLIRRKNKKLLKQAEQRYTWGSQKNGKSSGNPQKISLVVKKHIRNWEIHFVLSYYGSKYGSGNSMQKYKIFIQTLDP